MDNEIIHIIDKSERTNMSGPSTQYLCFRKFSDTKFELSIRAYLILGEIKDYYDEDAASYFVPDEIDGWSVNGADGEYVIGHLLVNQRDDILPIEFNSIDDPNVVEWLTYAKKYDDRIINDIKSHIAQY